MTTVDWPVLPAPAKAMEVRRWISAESPKFNSPFRQIADLEIFRGISGDVNGYLMSHVDKLFGGGYD